MAKKIVRGITDVKTINNQDFDTNNVNDLLSDGQYSYIHRKKGKSEEYHNLTDNIKTISSDNTDLLTVTNNNKTTNTATLHPKHDAQKEQVLQSTRNTISINHGANGTDEKTTVDTNPKKVLEHEKLISNSQYVTIEHDEESDISEIKTNKLANKLNELDNKIPTSVGTVNLFKGSRDFTGSYWINSTNGYYAEDYQSVKIFKTKRNWNGLSQYFEVKTGEEYVFSAYVKSSAKTDNATFYLLHKPKQPMASGLVGFDSANTQDLVNFDLTDEYKRIAIKIKITKDGWIAPRLERTDESAYLFFGGYKLERGKVPSDYEPSYEDAITLLAQKQNKLTSMGGISITGDSISLTAIDNYSGDLNNLTYTCLAKPIDNTSNLPTGVGGNGLLTVNRIGYVASQTYHALDNNIYYRIGNNSSSTFVWTSWVKVTTATI